MEVSWTKKVPSTTMNEIHHLEPKVGNKPNKPKVQVLFVFLDLKAHNHNLYLYLETHINRNNMSGLFEIPFFFPSFFSESKVLP